MLKSISVMLILLQVSCENPSRSLGSGFELHRVSSESALSVAWILQNGEQILVRGPLLGLGYDDKFIVAQNSKGYWFFEKKLVIVSKPPAAAVNGPYKREQYVELAKVLGLPHIRKDHLDQ